MKRLKVFIPFIFASVSAAAQVPEKAKDISPLLIGEKIPNSKLLTLNNEEVNLNSLISKKSSVIVVYRGGWCPFCNTQLSGLAQIQDEINQLGFQIIAISPDNVTDLNNTENKDNFKYQLLSDQNGEFIKNMGIAFQTNTMTKAYIFSKGRSVSEILPVPTVLIVNKKGEILFEYINPNYKQRLNGNMLLAVLKSIEKEQE